MSNQESEQKNGGGGERRSTLFGKYEIGRLLGQGTFAKVYYAKEIHSGESVAIKIINKDQVRKEGLMEQIKREISVMRLVRHPNVVELKEVMATRGKIFFVMEYVRGGELFAKVAKGKLPEDTARKYFQQLISAVDFCHSRGVSHRDLKPENLLLDENENLKISDFGLSALPEHLRNDGLLHTQCGTPAYVAPEVLKRKGYDGSKADIWSCGVILYVLLAGFLPFQDENIMKMYKKVYKAEYVFPRWFSQDTKRLISKLLVSDPEKRISIESIMKVSWFHKGFSRSSSYVNLASMGGGASPFKFDDDNNTITKSLSKTPSPTKSTKPAFFNAFELISSMSSGFDLSNLFESKKKTKSMFTSKLSASAIMMKLESVAKGLRFKVAKVKAFKVKMQGSEEGRKGKLLITAEVFEVAPEVAIVEFSKSSGDSLEYDKFCEDCVRPALKDIVWSWQGDDNDSSVDGNSCVTGSTSYADLQELTVN